MNSRHRPGIAAAVRVIGWPSLFAGLAVLAVASHRAGATPSPGVVAVEPTPRPGVAALVNGIAVEADAVQQLVKGMARAEPQPPDSARIDELTSSALESLIDLELLYQEAVRRKVELADDDVERQIADLRKHFDSQEAFAAALASRGMTPADLRLDTRRTLMAERLLQSTVWRGLRVDSAEVQRFYDDNRSRLSQPLEELDASIAQMLLDEKKAARRAELVARLREGASVVRFPPYGPGARARSPQPAPGAPTPATPADPD